ncbi:MULTISPECIES: endonuclease VII domain-containing protein [unclassified Thioalkalivibrio]|uniref:endonuclease VII domain-containing protein n=1 Tax=unclassified Thioalkalivibrio TaxID=2621013 RepID=UPI0009DAFBF5
MNRTCKVCQSEKPLAPEFFRLGFNKAKNGVKRPTYRKTCRSCEREATRKHVFKSTRGITVEERDSLLEAQGGCCAACGATEPGGKKGWHVDHCHKSGEIRAVLCATCNIALGQVDDSIERLENLINYLKRHKE